MNKLLRYRILTLLLPVQIIFIIGISHFPEVVEKYYSNGIYPIISRIFRLLFGWLPFSAGDILYFLIGLSLLIGLIKFFRDTRKSYKEHLYRLGAYLSVFFFLFHFLWAMNYHRETAFKRFDIPARDYTVEELNTLANGLLKKLKQVQLQLVNNDTLKVTIPYSKKELLERTLLGYKELAKIYTGLTYNTSSLKNSMYSLPLTYMGFAGYFNPLSGEAQVDYLVPKVSLAMISSHEIAHQVGIGSEAEANFVGYLAATHNPDTYFNYSGYLTGFRFSVAAMYYKDSIAAKRVIDSIPKGIMKNIEESKEFWLSYQNQLEPVFKLFYDNYLKANQQKDGLKSYSNMIYLLAAYHNKYGMPQ